MIFYIVNMWIQRFIYALHTPYTRFIHAIYTLYTRYRYAIYWKQILSIDISIDGYFLLIALSLSDGLLEANDIWEEKGGYFAKWITLGTRLLPGSGFLFRRSRIGAWCGPVESLVCPRHLDSCAIGPWFCRASLLVYGNVRK